MPATSANPNAAWFVKELTAARVFEPAQLAPYLAEFKATQRGGDAVALAEFFVGSGLLTRYQADRCLAGDARRLVLGPYFLAQPIGSGSIGEVYQAIGRSDRKRYAVKVLPLRSLWNVRQAKNQVQAFARLPAHPAIVPFVDVDSAGGSHYLVWPFVEGHSLTSRVRERGPASIPAALQVMTQAAEGLAVCHAHGIAHGLFSPSNLRIGTDGQIRILDLGVGAILSENIADDESMLDTLSAANATMGMIDCCAPETLNSPTLRDPAGDIYSFGCTFFYLLTGRLPFPGGNVVDKVLAHQTEPPPSVREFNPNVPGWIDDLIGRLMAKAPSRRPGSIDEVLSRLLTGSSEEYVELPEVVDVPEEEPAAEIEAPASSQCETPSDSRPGIADRPTPRSERAPPSASEIDFGNYIPPSDSGNSPNGEKEPSLVDLVIPDTLELIAADTERSIAQATTKSFAAMPAPVAFYEPPAAPEIAPPAPVAPKPTRSVWSRIRSAFGGARPAASDIVQLSVYGPPEVAPGQSIRVQVFAHLPETFDSVRTLSRAFHCDSILLATGYVGRPIERGAELKLVLKVRNAGVAQAELELAWLGQSHPRSFDVHVPWEAPSGSTPATLTVGADGKDPTEVAFPIQILPRRG